MTLAERMYNLGTETAFEVLAKARALEAQGREIIHLEIGEPDFDTPRHIVDAGVRALQEGYTHYGPTPGLPELREAVARNSREVRGIDTDPGQVVVTPGAKPIMFYVILALAEPGAEVIYPNPGFPIYESMIRFSGATPVPMQLLEEKDYHPDLDDLAGKITDRTRLIIINSPENPCGSALSREELETIANLARGRNLYVMADEIYKDILYTGEHFSIAAFPGHGQADGHPGRLFQELRHDRLAAGLRHHARGTGAPHHPAGGKQRLMRRVLQPAGRRPPPWTAPRTRFRPWPPSLPSAAA